MNTPYNEGYDSAMEGISDLYNPYEIGSDDAMSWDDGYQAFCDEHWQGGE